MSLLLLFGGSGIAAPIEPADGEIIYVKAQDRTISIPAQDRTIAARANDRTILIPERPTP